MKRSNLLGSTSLLLMLALIIIVGVSSCKKETVEPEAPVEVIDMTKFKEIQGLWMLDSICDNYRSKTTVYNTVGGPRAKVVNNVLTKYYYLIDYLNKKPGNPYTIKYLLTPFQWGANYYNFTWENHTYYRVVGNKMYMITPKDNVYYFYTLDPKNK